MISDHPNGRTPFINGQFAGQTLSEVWLTHRELFGRNAAESFPLLVKVITTKADLSVQVHPDDEYASLHEKGDRGKTEAWWILKAEPDAQIVYGHRAANRDQFLKMAGQQKWDELLVYRHVRAGDFYFVPSGCVHAIGKGIVLLEIQQSSDTTYRVYDYDRLGEDGIPRQLHLQKAVEVALFNRFWQPPSPETTTVGRHEFTRYVRCSFFKIEGWNIRGSFTCATPIHSFLLVSVVNGAGSFRWPDGEVSIVNRDHFMLPATLGKFEIDGELDLIVTTM